MFVKSIILIRGLPGSGKSSLARVISGNGNYPIYSVDDFFTDKESGSYNFDHKQNHLAYSACVDNTRKSMEARCEKIFVDNTFTMDWEMEPYEKLAKEFDYRVYVVTVENRHGGTNIHGISEEMVERMASKYEVKLIPPKKKS